MAAGLTGADLTDCEFDVGNTSDAGYAAAMTASSGVIPGAAPTSAPGGPTGSVTGDIVPGQTVSGTVAPNAKKSYNFHAPAGTVAYFAANPSCADTAAPDVVWNLADATGSPLVGSSVICNDLGRAVFPKDGSYSLVVANSGSTSEPFSVTWEASRPDQIKQLQPGQTLQRHDRQARCPRPLDCDGASGHGGVPGRRPVVRPPEPAVERPGR